MLLPSGLYVASLLKNLDTERDHSRCIRTRCISAQIDKSSYKVQHTPRDCKYPCLGVSQQAIIQSLHRGRYPLLRLERENGELRLSVQDSGERTTYTALPHVWADGLGNPHGPELPICQLCHINNLIFKLPKPLKVDHLTDSLPEERGFPLFWVDTICVPTEEGKMKQLALSRMIETYAKAQNVLVIDRGLKNAVASPNMLENATRVFLSGWSQRLWTLQEGCSNTSVWFQFSDRALSFKEIMQSLDGETYWQSKNYDLVEPASSHIVKMISTFSFILYEEDEAVLASVWNALQWRSTSVDTDQAICLAILLGFDPTLLEDIPQEEAIAEVLSQLINQPLPPNLIFFPGKKQRRRGLGWAPDSFFDRSIAWSPQPNSPLVVPISTGLPVEFPGLLVPTCAYLRRSMVVCVPQTLSTFFINVSEDRDLDASWKYVLPKDLNIGLTIILPRNLSFGERTVALLGLFSTTSVNSRIDFEPIRTAKIRRAALIESLAITTHLDESHLVKSNIIKLLETWTADRGPISSLELEHLSRNREAVRENLISTSWLTDDNFHEASLYYESASWLVG